MIGTVARRHVTRAIAVGALASLPMLALAGCSTQKMVSSSELAAQAQAALEETTGGTVPPVSCPSDIEAKVGTSTTCTITDGGQTFDVTLTITSVDESTNSVQFDVQVADEPAS